MKVVAITGEHRTELVEKPDPKASGEFVVVRIDVVPMCTEWKSWKHGWLGDCLGHEAAGTVAETDGPRRVKVGQRVVVMPQVPCGSCELCQRGEFVYCEQSFDALAATGNSAGTATYAQKMIKQDWMLVPIPDDLSTEHGSMLNCALGPAFGAIRRLGTSGLHRVLVTGLGPVGLGAVILAKRCGARVLATDPSPYRRNLALELGADLALDPTEDGALEKAKEWSGGTGVDQVIECAGSPAAQKFGIDAVRRLGSVALVGEGGDLTVHVSNDLLRKGLTVHASWYYNLADTGPLMQIVRESRPQLDKLITHRMPMAEVQQAFELQAKAECGKVLLSP